MASNKGSNLTKPTSFAGATFVRAKNWYFRSVGQGEMMQIETIQCNENPVGRSSVRYIPNGELSFTNCPNPGLYDWHNWSAAHPFVGRPCSAVLDCCNDSGGKFKLHMYVSVWIAINRWKDITLHMCCLWALKSRCIQRRKHLGWQQHYAKCVWVRFSVSPETFRDENQLITVDMLMAKPRSRLCRSWDVTPRNERRYEL